MSVVDRIASLTPEQRELFEKLRQQRQQERSAARVHQPPPVVRVSGLAGAGDWPLSLDQERFWFMEQLHPGRAGLNIVAATRMRGRLAVPPLAAALDEITRRHAAWRTTFPLVDGAPVQRVVPSRRHPLQPLALIDLAALPAERRDSEALRLVGADAATPFDLERGPLMRASLIRLTDDDFVCLLTIHHLVTDWVSFQIAWGELAVLYDAYATGDLAAVRALPAPPVHYPDFAVWQRDWLQGEVLDDLVAWWRERLAGVPLALEIPTDRPRPPVTRMRGGQLPVRISSPLSAALRALARGEGATLFMTVMAATAALLHRDSGQERLILGANNANRNRPELAPVLGCFLTQVPFTLDLSGDPSFRELLARARQSALASYAHQDLPFGKLVEAVQPSRDTSRQPVVQALIQVLDGQISQASLAGVTFAGLDAHDGNARYDLMLSLFDYPDGIEGTLEYDSDLFDATTTVRRLERFLLQAAAVTADPDLPLSALPVLPEGARQQALVEWNDTGRPHPGWTAPERFAAQAALTPEALAVVVGASDETLFYRELDRRSDELARRLLRLGVGPETRVALLLGRTLDLPIAIFGVWKAGGAYLPLDPDSPAERLADLLADAAPSVVIHRGAPKLPADEAVRWLDLAEPEPDSPAVPLPTAAPGDLAYLIYTSGTTGKPKAVMIEHGQLAVTLETVAQRFALAPGDRVPHLFRATFDASLMDLVAPLLVGAAVEIVSREEILEPERLLAVLERSTVVFTVPALLRRTLAGARERGGERFAALRALGVGADLVAPELQQELLETFPAAAVEVLYGPTEAAIICAAHRVPRGVPPERALIGHPLPEVELRVMSPHGEAVALGVPGELWIGGAGVARGYFRRDELTAERFVIKEGRRFYRSGDLVRQVADEGGSLEFLGRIDHQVKVRGFRVEPGEIEAALREHPAVREAVAVALPDAAGDRYLAAYYVLEEGRSIAPAGLREHLAARLPAYMVPSAFVLLPALPLTTNGKVDRASLPAPAAREAAAGEGPRTPAEEVVAGVWCEVLGLPPAAQMARSANFFELGGHSLLATQVVSRLRAATGAEMAVGEMFQSPTVAALAAALEVSLSAGAASTAAPPIRPVPRQGDLPLSFAQERLWFLDRLAPGNAAYNIPLALAARGELSLPALAASLGEMVRRHEALRTTYVARGDRPVQVIAPAGAWTLPLIDLAVLPEGTREGEVRRLADALVVRPFDLDRDPVLRASALRLGSQDHALLLVVHHIASDGWSLGVIVEEIAALYPAALTGTASPLPELAVQYADFAVWQRGWLQGEALDRQLGYWRQRLAGAAALDLPTDRPRPPAQSFRGATRMQAIGPETTAALGAFARRHDATLFMVLLSAVQTLLGRYAGQDEVVVGSPIANRTRAEIEPLIGFFVNSLVLRGDLAGDPAFAELVGRSRRAALEAYAHQDLPFERLVEELRPDRRQAHNPLFQVMFAVQNAPMRAIELPGITFSAVDFEFPATRFDLEIFFTEAAGGMAVQLTYGTDLFDAATIARLEGHLATLLAALLADPSRRLSELALLTAPEVHQVRLAWNDTAAAIPAEDVAALFSAQARRRPDAVAVASEAGDLTYAELEARSSRLARRLAAAGVGPEIRVALLAQRSPAMIVGLLGILKAGGAYVPLDPSYPAERLAWMLADSGSRVLLGQPELLAELPEAPGLPVIELTAGAEPEGEEPEGEEPGPEPVGPLPDGLAYVMYTSGSTGRPKGVGVTHRNIVRLVRESGFADLGEDQVFLQLAPISFDASTLEIWAPLANGGRIAVFPPRRPSLEELGEAIARFGVTSLWLTAGLFHQMVDDRLAALRPLRQLLAGGDVLSPSHVRRTLAALPGLTLINGYGPTEGTTFTCCFPMTSPEQVGSTVPLGRPIGNTRVHVLDAALGSVPAGVWGELCLGGDGLSRGYLGRPELTAERFVPDPFADAATDGSRLYRTGDVVRFRADGRIEFAGRRDGQVKLRGFRIELGEIESALARHPAVREATVVSRDDGGPLGARLVAYVAPNPPEAAATAEPAEAQADQRHVEQWRELYEQTYAKGAPAEAGGDATFNLQGWNSSYTGESIPAAEMREWLDGTVGRLLALPHRRVLEVGCGTGLLLFRVAPEAERYRGTDFSAVALAQVHAELTRRALPQVELAQGLADDWTEVRAGDFDLVVLNSVVQYFPGVDYLVKVLEGAVTAVAPGGSVFVGDVRSLPLLEALHASVQLHRAAGSLPVAELARRVGRRTADEEELVIDPGLFVALARRLPAVRRVRVLLKRGRGINELTRFRYDVVLDVGPARPEEAEPEILPQAWESLASLERRLAARPATLAVAGIPNARLAGEAAALALLHGEGREMETVDELRAEISARASAAAVEPEDLWALADRLGYDADLTPSAGVVVDGRFDAALRRRGTGLPAGVDPRAASEAEDLPWSSYANDPLRADHERWLAPELRRFLEAALPEYMVPAAFVLLDALPLTVNGKVDRAALPAPEPIVATAEEWVPPATPLEERLAQATAEVLGLERVGMRDNFFDLGGHSLLATQLVSRLTQGHGIQVTLQMIFDARDLGELADRIVEAELAAADAEELDAALREVDGLSADELRALLEPVEETR